MCWHLGQFVSGKPHGAGYIRYANSDEHLGMFQQGASHGVGIFTSNEQKPTGTNQWSKGCMQQTPLHVSGLSFCLRALLPQLSDIAQRA